MKDDLVVSDMKAFQNAKKAAKNIGVTNSSLNKYSQVLESYGYRFKKEGNKIAYLEKDIVVLKKLKELAVSGGMNVHEAARAVLTMFDASSQVEAPKVNAPVKHEREQLTQETSQDKQSKSQAIQKNADIQKKVEVTKELESSKQEIAVTKPKKSELTKKAITEPKAVLVDEKKGLKKLKLTPPNLKDEKVQEPEKGVEKAEQVLVQSKKADNSALNMDSIEEKLDKAIKFITQREISNEELKKLLREKDSIIAKLKEENANYQKEKEVINLRDKVLLETIRKRQEERKKTSVNLSFWEKRKRG